MSELFSGTEEERRAQSEEMDLLEAKFKKQGGAKSPIDWSGQAQQNEWEMYDIYLKCIAGGDTSPNLLRMMWEDRLYADKSEGEFSATCCEKNLVHHGTQEGGDMICSECGFIATPMDLLTVHGLESSIGAITQGYPGEAHHG